MDSFKPDVAATFPAAGVQTIEPSRPLTIARENAAIRAAARVNVWTAPAKRYAAMTPAEIRRRLTQTPAGRPKGA